MTVRCGVLPGTRTKNFLAFVDDDTSFRGVRGYKGYRFRIYPSAEQEKRLLDWEDSLRFLWNLALEQRKLGLLRPSPVYPSAFDQINELTDLRAALPWLAD